MIIDFHCHFFRKNHFPDYFWNGQAEFFHGYFQGQGKTKDIDQINREFIPVFWEAHDRNAIHQMDEAGIDKAVILHVDFTYGREDDLQPVEVQHRQIHDLISQYPDRYIYFMGIDPRWPSAWKPLVDKKEEYNIRGVKLNPVAGFYPDNKEFFGFYERIAELSLPVMMHQGPLFEPFESESSHPYRLEAVLKAFPQISFIAAHMAFAWWRELLEVAGKYENIMCDISGWQLVVASNPAKFVHILRKVIDGFGKHRVLFGTDSATFDRFISKKEWVDFIKGLSDESFGQDRITQEEIQALLGDNAARLFGF